MQKKKQIFLGITFLLVCIIGLYSIYLEIKVNCSMPVLYITLTQDEALEKKEYSEASITIDYPRQLTAENLTMQIRERGNGSYGLQKAAYKIKLDEKADLLLGASADSDEAARDWVLLAEYFDRSTLRNYYAFMIAENFENLDFISSCMLVEVYFNGEYQGVYLLCEQVEVDEARVDIDDTTETDKGFLVELRTYQKQDYAVTIMYDDDEMVYDIRSQIDSQDDVDRVQSVMQAAQDAIETGDQETIAAVIDIDSCVDMYILQEYLMNIDVGWGSFYMYCEAGEEKLYFGSPWDFDRCAGMDSRLNEGSYEGLYVGASEQTFVQQHPWYQALMQEEWFQALVRERWNEKKDMLLASIDTLELDAARYSTQLWSNYQLWRVERGEYIDCTAYAGSFDEDIAYLIDWLHNRYAWLDDYFNNVM